ncbi:MAG: GxxExxY protein [Planctomycetota bacterium]|nr:GxxExxY protein [Planctomycetota bacterium]
MTENDQIVYRQLSYEIVGCAQRVHTTLGPGFPESVYQRALCRELLNQKIPFASEAPFEVYYEDAIAGKFRVDIFVDDRIVLELKAVSDICDDHISQAYAYLKASGAKLAMLIDFGKRRLQTKRIVMSKRKI